MTNPTKEQLELLENWEEKAKIILIAWFAWQTARLSNSNSSEEDWDSNKPIAFIEAIKSAQEAKTRMEVEKEYLSIIEKAYYIDKNFTTTDEDLADLRGDIVLAFPAETREIITLWVQAQNSNQ